MKLWLSIYHATHEPDPSSGLAIIAPEKTLTYNLDVKLQNSGILTLRK